MPRKRRCSTNALRLIIYFPKSRISFRRKTEERVRRALQDDNAIQALSEAFGTPVELELDYGRWDANDEEMYYGVGFH